MEVKSNAGQRMVASLWSVPLRQACFFGLALATTATLLFLRLVQLEQLQNEFYGDITIAYEYVRKIREGRWPSYFETSAGPLYHYLITPIIALTGPTYLGFKLASVTVSLGVLAVTYALCRRLVDDWFALLVVTIAGISSWMLIFSRLGNSQILVPLLAVGAIWLAVCFVQDGRRRDLVAAAVISALGLYVYPQSFILPGVTFLVLLSLQWTGAARSARTSAAAEAVRLTDLGLLVAVTFVCALPFTWIVLRNLQDFLTGYIGTKFQASGNLLVLFLHNFANGILAFHLHGDISARSNIMGVPHLDVVSGLLMLGGVIFWLLPPRRRWSPVLFLPLILLQVPSMLVLSHAAEVPSASRTLGAAPFAYILVGSGLYWLGELLLRVDRRATATAIAVLLGAIVLLNANRYFRQYIPGLPYNNTPVGHLITEYVDSLPPGTQIYLVGCCWHGGMPEPKSIQYSMARPGDLHLLNQQDQLTCDWLQWSPQPVVLIWSDQQDLPSPALAGCPAWLPAQVYVSRDGLPIFHAAPVRTDMGRLPGAPEEAADPLVYSSTAYYGQTIGVRYSELDIGQVSDLFDGNLQSLARGASANPLVLELHFLKPLAGAVLHLGLATMRQFQVKVTLTYADDTTDMVLKGFEDLPADPEVDVPLPAGQAQPIKIARIAIEDFTPSNGGVFHIHVREVEFR